MHIAAQICLETYVQTIFHEKQARIALFKCYVVRAFLLNVKKFKAILLYVETPKNVTHTAHYEISFLIPIYHTDITEDFQKNLQTL